MSSSRCSTPCWPSSTRLCEAKFGALNLYEGEVFGTPRYTTCRPHMRKMASPCDASPIQRARMLKSSGRNVGSHRRRAKRSRHILKAIPLSWLCRPRGRPDDPCRSDAQGERADRRDQHLSPGSSPVHRQADRAGTDFRRPGRDRDRERAAVRRGAGAHDASSRGRSRSCARSATSPRRSTPRSTCRPCSTPSSPRRRSFPAPRPA